MTTVDERPVLDQQDVEAAMGRVMGDYAAAIAVTTVSLGITSGAWKAMAEAGPITPAELASRIGTVEPYAHEWLATQAAGGYVSYDPATERFTLPDAMAAVLADDAQTGVFVAFGEAMKVMGADMTLFEERFTTGRGFGWHERSPGHWDAMADISAASVLPFLPAWLAEIDGLAEQLAAGGKVADVGCGYGAALLSIAHQHAAVRTYGFDYHDGSVAHARDAATAAGVSDRARFEVATAKDYPGNDYALILFVDSLHDLGDPVGALEHARDALAPDGCVLLVEPDCADRLEDNLNPIGRLWYAISTTVCTPNGVAQEGHPLGTVAGEARLREAATSAGFTRFRRLDGPAPLNIPLELRP
jgi:SAM-dependent methyltransferase